MHNAVLTMAAGAATAMTAAAGSEILEGGPQLLPHLTMSVLGAVGGTAFFIKDLPGDDEASQRRRFWYAGTVFLGSVSFGIGLGRFAASLPYLDAAKHGESSFLSAAFALAVYGVGKAVIRKRAGLSGDRA